eukprot:3496990-Pyramimonas_sp.AAC.1
MGQPVQALAVTVGAAVVPGSGGELATAEQANRPPQRAPPELMTEFHIYHANITKWNDKAKK